MLSAGTAWVLGFPQSVDLWVWGLRALHRAGHALVARCLTPEGFAYFMVMIQVAYIVGTFLAAHFIEFSSYPLYFHASLGFCAAVLVLFARLRAGFLRYRPGPRHPATACPAASMRSFRCSCSPPPLGWSCSSRRC